MSQLAGFSVDNSTLYVFMPKGKPLYDYIHAKEPAMKLTFEEKHLIALDICKVFSRLHSLDPPMCHGHLTSHNIFIERTANGVRAMIGELQMQPFCKLANTFLSYRNATVWSPPEVLAKQKIVLDPTPEIDIYSFGMILW